MNMMRRPTAMQVSPLALLTLAACGGSGGGGAPVSSPAPTTDANGNVVKGPLQNSWVYIDYLNDGIEYNLATLASRFGAGETDVDKTDATGAYSLTFDASLGAYQVVAVTDGNTIDTSSGAVLSGVTLKAPSNATVVTPTTTLMSEGSLTAAQVAEVLGLPDGVDPLTYNAFDTSAAGYNAQTALAVEKASQQIMSAITAFAGAVEGAGASEADAFSAALKSVATVVQAKAAKLTDATASSADKTLDFTNAADLLLVQNAVSAEVTNNTTLSTTVKRTAIMGHRNGCDIA